MIRSDEVASSAPAKQPRAGTARWRGMTVGMAGLAAVLGTALVPALSPAGAAGDSVAVVIGSGGSSAPSLGVPAAPGSAKISPTYVAYDPSNGDTAVASTQAGSVYVYLIAGASEANEYNIQTAPNPTPAFGSLSSGDAYLVAGTGTAGLIAQPGNNQFGNSTTAVATANPITPTSVAFDPNGNLLIAGENGTVSAIQVVAKTTGTFYGVSMTAGDLYTIADVGVSGAPSSAINMGAVAAPANGMSVDSSGNIVVGNGIGVDFVNETSGSLNLYGKSIAAQSSVIIAGSLRGVTDCSSGAASASASSLYFQSPAPFVDSSDNVYLSDNESGGSNGGGCDWVLPAQSGTLDGLSVTAGSAYKLAGNGGTTATSNGTAGVDANVSGTSQMTVDGAGNVVLAVSGAQAGTSPALQVLAESTATYYGVSMTAGDVYTVAGGPSNTLATLSGPSSLTNIGSGNLYFTDGAASSANLDEFSGAPTAPIAVPVVSSVSPNAGPLGGTTGVTITGSNFTGATAVDFGTGHAGTDATVVSPSEITVNAPAESAATVDVTVTTPNGTSATSSADQFTYQAAVATPENTTTSLSVPTLTFGSEGSPVAFTGTVAGPSSADGVPAGTVTVYYDYGVTGQTQLCQETLSGGSGDSVNYSCSLASATQLPAGAYTNVVAAYSGGSSSNTSFTYNASTSSPQGFTVSPASATPENTTTSLSVPTLTFGSEGSPVAFTGTVAGPSSADGVPAGTVTVYYDYGVTGQTQLCQETLSGGSGDSVNYSCSLASATQLPAGAYTNVVAAYSGGSSSNTSFTYNASTSSPQGLTVSPEPANTTTSLSVPTLTFGSEGSPVAFTGTVAGPSSADGVPAGTVTVYYDYGVTGQTQLCQETLSGGSGDSVNYSCSLASATQLPAGAYTNVVAAYSGGSSSNTSFTYNASTSSPQGFTVSPASATPENTTTSLSVPTLTFGSEGSPVAFTGTVAGPSSADGVPAGTVTVYYDYGVTGQTQLCQETLSGGSGDSVNYSCSLASATQLPAGAYTNVVAAYSGGSSSNTSFTYNASTSSPQGLTVSPEPANTTTSLSVPTLTFGSEGSPVAFTGTVAGPSSADGVPAGTVTVYYDYGVTGQTQLCQETLSGGSGDSVNYSCSLASATQLPAGAYTNVVAAYSGGSSSNTSFTYNASTSSPQGFTVSPASATPENTTTSLSVPTLTFGSEGSPVAFTGTVAGPSSADGVPAGTVTVYYDYGVTGQTQLCQETLSGGSGDSVNYSCSLASATQLPAGAYTNVVAAYSGGSSSNTSFTYNASTSSPQGLTVSPASTSANNLKIQLSSWRLLWGIGGLYQIKVTNEAGTATTGTLTVTDALPTGLSYLGAGSLPPGWHCSATAGTVACTSTKAIAAHGFDYLTLRVRVERAAGCEHHQHGQSDTGRDPGEQLHVERHHEGGGLFWSGISREVPEPQARWDAVRAQAVAVRRIRAVRAGAEYLSPHTAP